MLFHLLPLTLALISPFAPRATSSLLRADVRLQRGNLIVERGNVLPDDVGEFGYLDGAVVE
jgi:hypothetical protein